MVRRSTGMLVVLAVAVRVAAILVLRSHELPRSTYEHGEIAANLLAGRGFSIRFLHVEGPTSMQAPLYPWIVTAAFALGGIDTPRSRLIIQLGQAVLGGVLVLAVMALSRRIAPDRRRLPHLAGLAAAGYPTLVYAATHVQVALLAATLLTAALALAYQAGQSLRRRDAAAAGGVLGLLALTDPILGLVAPGMAWAVWAGRESSARTSLGRIGLMAVAALITVAPWVVRNARVHGEFVPVKSTFGYAFWQGNCNLSHGTDKVVRASVDQTLAAAAAKPGDSTSLSAWNRTLWAARHEAGYIDDIALSAADYRTLAPLSEPARSRWLLTRARAELRERPGRYGQLCLDRLGAFVFFDPTNPKTRSSLYRVAHLALTGLAAWGLLTMGGPLRRRMGPTVLTALLVGTFHVLTIVSARFHIPLEPLMGLWAAAGIDRGLELAAALRPSAHTPSAQPRRLTTSNASGS